jgi:hypothetical protein
MSTRTGYYGRLKTLAQDNDEPSQELAAATEGMTHHAVPVLHKSLGSGRPGGAFGNGTMDRGMEWQLPLGREKTLNEALGPTVELEVIKVVIVFSGGPRKMREWKSSRSRPPPKRKKRRHRHVPSEKKEIVTRL